MGVRLQPLAFLLAASLLLGGCGSRKAARRADDRPSTYGFGAKGKGTTARRSGKPRRGRSPQRPMRLAWDEPLAGSSRVRDEDRALFGSGSPLPVPKEKDHGHETTGPRRDGPPEGAESPRDIAARIVGKRPVEIRPHDDGESPELIRPPMTDLAGKVIVRPRTPSRPAPPTDLFENRPPASRPFDPTARIPAATTAPRSPRPTRPAFPPRPTVRPRPTVPPRPTRLASLPTPSARPRRSIELPSLHRRDAPPPAPTRSPLRAAPPEAFPQGASHTASARAPQAGPQTHVVQRGETLFSIGRTFGISPVRLSRYNRIADPDLLRPGMVLKIPQDETPIRPTVRHDATPPRPTQVAARPRPAATPAVARPRPVSPTPVPPPVSRPVVRPGTVHRKHRLEKGETLWAVAKRYGVALKDLVETNRISRLSSLEEGLVIDIPLPSRRPQSAARPSAATRPAAATRKPSTPPRPRRAPTATTTLARWPLEGKVVRRFGWHEGRPSTGLAIEGQPGDVVRAAAPGKVIYSSTMRNYGKVVILAHPDEVFTVYGNCALLLVSKGTKAKPTMVRTGDPVARIGGAGSAEGSRLHFEVRMRNKAVDPLLHLPPR